jgi:hypothetical protein
MLEAHRGNWMLKNTIAHLPADVLAKAALALTALASLQACSSPLKPDGISDQPSIRISDRTPIIASPNGPAFYIDCTAGNDNAAGTSSGSAWKTMRKANSAKLKPGESLLFKRGCTFQGPLNATWHGTALAPVFIGAYGDGNAATIRNGSPAVILISGTNQVIDGLEVNADQPGPYRGARKCQSTANGWLAGVQFGGPSNNNTVQRSKISGFTAGVHFAGGSRNHAIANTIFNNTVMSQNTPERYDDDSGAWGVLLNADNNEVAFNTFSGNSACSEDYGIDGASVEVYQASSNLVHHNVSINDSTFTELGGSPDRPSQNNSFAFNIFAPIKNGGELLNLRGRQSKWGGNPGTKFYNNTAYMVSVGITCSDGCDGSILSARNNIIWSRDNTDRSALWATGPFDEGNNFFWRSDGRPSVVVQGGRLAASSKVVNPKFIDVSKLDFHLSPDSPAVNAGAYAKGDTNTANLGIQAVLETP